MSTPTLDISRSHMIRLSSLGQKQIIEMRKTPEIQNVQRIILCKEIAAIETMKALWPSTWQTKAVFINTPPCDEELHTTFSKTNELKLKKKCPTSLCVEINHIPGYDNMQVVATTTKWDTSGIEEMFSYLKELKDQYVVVLAHASRLSKLSSLFNRSPVHFEDGQVQEFELSEHIDYSLSQCVINHEETMTLFANVMKFIQFACNCTESPMTTLIRKGQEEARASTLPGQITVRVLPNLKLYEWRSLEKFILDTVNLFVKPSYEVQTVTSWVLEKSQKANKKKYDYVLITLFSNQNCPDQNGPSYDILSPSRSMDSYGILPESILYLVPIAALQTLENQIKTENRCEDCGESLAICGVETQNEGQISCGVCGRVAFGEIMNEGALPEYENRESRNHHSVSKAPDDQYLSSNMQLQTGPIGNSSNFNRLNRAAASAHQIYANQNKVATTDTGVDYKDKEIVRACRIYSSYQGHLNSYFTHAILEEAKRLFMVKRMIRNELRGTVKGNGFVEHAAISWFAAWFKHYENKTQAIRKHGVSMKQLAIPNWDGPVALKRFQKQQDNKHHPRTKSSSSNSNSTTRPLQKKKRTLQESLDALLNSRRAKKMQKI